VDSVRHLFKPQCREAVMNAGSVCIEGSGSWLIVYRARKRVEPQQVTDFLEAARMLRESFVE
jgi:hypothetical protein